LEENLFTPLAGLQIRLEFFLERFASALSERHRRGICVARRSKKRKSSVGAAYSEDVALDGAWKIVFLRFLQICRTCGAKKLDSLQSKFKLTA
jgi:hypothetical protein